MRVIIEPIKEGFQVSVEQGAPEAAEAPAPDGMPAGPDAAPEAPMAPAEPVSQAFPTIKAALTAAAEALRGGQMADQQGQDEAFAAQFGNKQGALV